MDNSAEDWIPLSHHSFHLHPKFNFLIAGEPSRTSAQSASTTGGSAAKARQGLFPVHKFKSVNITVSPFFILGKVNTVRSNKGYSLFLIDVSEMKGLGGSTNFALKSAKLQMLANFDTAANFHLLDNGRTSFTYLFGPYFIN